MDVKRINFFCKAHEREHKPYLFLLLCQNWQIPNEMNNKSNPGIQLMDYLTYLRTEFDIHKIFKPSEKNILRIRLLM